MRELAPELRTAFLARQMIVDDLTDFSDVELAAAAASARQEDVLKLERWLATVKEVRPTWEGAATERPQRAMRKRESSSSRGEAGFLRSRVGLMPQRPMDWRIAKRISPVQNYADDS